LHQLFQNYRFDLGHISINDWCDVVRHVLDLQLPWRTLKSRLVEIDANGMVSYESTFRLQELQFASNSKLTDVN
jgi:serine/threonine-protein phosphatase with EF-hand domain